MNSSSSTSDCSKKMPRSNLDSSFQENKGSADNFVHISRNGEECPSPRVSVGIDRAASMSCEEKQMSMASETSFATASTKEMFSSDMSPILSHQRARKSKKSGFNIDRTAKITERVNDQSDGERPLTEKENVMDASPIAREFPSIDLQLETDEADSEDSSDFPSTIDKYSNKSDSKMEDICDSVHEALAKLDKTAHELDDSLVDYESMMSTSSGRIIEPHSARRPNRSSSIIGRRLSEDAAASVREFQSLEKAELVRLLHEKIAELEVSKDVNRLLSEKLAATQVDETIQDLNVMKLKKNEGARSIADKQRDAAMVTAFNVRIQNIEARHREEIARLNRVSSEKQSANRLQFRKKVAKQLRAFQRRHKKIVARHVETLTVAVSRMKRAESTLAKLDISAHPVIHQSNLPRENRALKNGSFLDSIRCWSSVSTSQDVVRSDERNSSGSIDLASEIETILDARFDWKGELARQVKAISKEVLIQICRAPEYRTLAASTSESAEKCDDLMESMYRSMSVKTRNAVVAVSRADDDNDEEDDDELASKFTTPDRTKAKAPTPSSTRSSIINEAIKEYPPELRALFAEPENARSDKAA